MSRIVGRWRRYKRKACEATYEYGPIVVVVGAVVGYLTWGQSWLR